MGHVVVRCHRMTGSVKNRGALWLVLWNRHLGRCGMQMIPGVHRPVFVLAGGMWNKDSTAERCHRLARHPGTLDPVGAGLVIWVPCCLVGG
jgi:hypothetical protein